MRPLRVFLGPVEVAGYYAQLQQGLESIGVRVTRLAMTQDSRAYGAPLPVWPSGLAARCMALARQRPNGLLGRLWSKLASLLLLLLAVRIIVQHDALVYAFAGSISWYPALELKLARALRRRIVFVFHGSDSRPPYLDGQSLARDRNPGIDAVQQLVVERRARVQFCDAVADAVIDNPFAAHFHNRACVNWHAVGIPFVRVPQTPPPPPAPGTLVRVLHSPSHPETKGTPHIRAVIAALQSRGVPIDYVEISGRPNAEVLQEIERADLVVDQAYSDVPMAGLATEAAAFGRPSVVGSLAVTQFADFIAAEDLPPVASCHPDDLESTIERLVQDRSARERLGREAHAFVLRHRAAHVVASRMVRVLQNDIPPSWLFDPRSVRYGGGCGDPSTIRRTIAALVERHGVAALGLDDRPAVRDAVLEEGSSLSTDAT
jgi:hypothetical protein